MVTRSTRQQKVTLEDIASYLDVSIATVSQVLSGKGNISQATRERVLQAVETLSYHPNEAARSLARRRTSQVSPGEAANHGKRNLKMPIKNLANILETEELSKLVEMEIQQREEEGCLVQDFREEFASQARWTRKKLLEFYFKLDAAPLNASLSLSEPQSLQEIRSLRPAGPRQERYIVTPAELYEKIYGGWLGRCTGCILGKPIEAGWSKTKVIQYLKLAKAYPLDNYIPRLLQLPETFDFNPESDGFFRDEINAMPPDDDLDYTILGLHLLETYGLTFTSEDVTTLWLAHLPYYRVYTAERIAYRNMVMDIAPPDTAEILNPAREFIGARIRADIFGLACPGNPELAASLAYRDAVLSHAKNGVYSAMFIAAAIAWSFMTDNVPEIIQAGLSEIPQSCRLAEAVNEVLSLKQEIADWEVAYDRLLLKYGSYHPVHAINNTVFVVLALLYSDGGFDRAVCTAVTCGLDTDCNGANVGAIMGVIHGSQKIPSRWIDPLHDTLYTTISQWKENRISELARRTAMIAQKNFLNNPP
jgi:ADP-ribosylglycohydrolase/transcriptional regulator with XRE-family HTH domain